MINSFIINPKDDVVTVTEPIPKGAAITYLKDDAECTVIALDDIPKYHKAAIRNVMDGAYVIKYGEVIGVATADIKAGNHVHTQNLTDVPREVLR